MTLIKAGIIGAGVAGGWHALSLKKIPEKVQLAFICDIDEKKGKRLKRTNKEANILTDYKELLARDDIDTVHICLPHFLHAEVTVEAAKYGKHILCEKPIANTLEECDKMIEATKKAGVKLMIAENQRFLPALIKIKEIIGKGTIGDIKLVRTYEGGSEVASMSDPNSWKCKWIEGGGGAWMDSGVHRIAVLNYLIGDIKSISGHAEKLLSQCEGKADDNCVMNVQFESGALGEIAISFTVASDWNCSLELYGTKGTILENHNWEKPIKLYSTLPGPNRCEWVEPEVFHEPYPGYYRISFLEEIKHFYDCVINNKEPEMSGEDGKKALEIVLLGYESAKSGKRIYRKNK